MIKALKCNLHYPYVNVEEQINDILNRKAKMKALMEAKRKPKSDDKFHC